MQRFFRWVGIGMLAAGVPVVAAWIYPQYANAASFDIGNKSGSTSYVVPLPQGVYPGPVVAKGTMTCGKTDTKGVATAILDKSSYKPGEQIKVSVTFDFTPSAGCFTSESITMIGVLNPGTAGAFAQSVAKELTRSWVQGKFMSDAFLRQLDPATVRRVVWKVPPGAAWAGKIEGELTFTAPSASGQNQLWIWAGAEEWGANPPWMAGWVPPTNPDLLSKFGGYISLSLTAVPPPAPTFIPPSVMLAPKPRLNFTISATNAAGTAKEADILKGAKATLGWKAVADPLGSYCGTWDNKKVYIERLWKQEGNTAYYVGSSGAAADTMSCVGAWDSAKSAWTQSTFCKYADQRECNPKGSALGGTAYTGTFPFPACPVGYRPGGTGHGKGDGCTADTSGAAVSPSSLPAPVKEVKCQPAAGSESGDFRGTLKSEGSAATAALGASRAFTLECWGVDERGAQSSEKAQETVRAKVAEPTPPVMPVFAPLDYFSLTNSGDIAVVQGETGSNTITTVKGKDAYRGMVLLYHNLKLEKAGISLEPAAVPAGAASAFSVSTSPEVPAGAYPVTVTGKTPPVLGGNCTTSHSESGNGISCASVFRSASLQLNSGAGVSFPGAIEFYGKFADAVCGANNGSAGSPQDWTTVKGSSPVLLGQNGGTGSFSCTDLAKTQVERATAFKVIVAAKPPAPVVTTPSTGKRWDGWIKLSGTAKDGSKYGVKYDPKTTRFCGYAWGGDVMGWIKFGPIPDPTKNPDWICDRTATRDAKGNVVSAPPYRVIPGSPSGDWVRLGNTPINADIYTNENPPYVHPTLTPDTLITNNDYRLTGYAWSSNIGWIQMGASPLGKCGVDAVVCMNASVPGAVERKLIGWAWSPNIGWVKFDAKKVTPEDYPEVPFNPSYLNIKNTTDDKGTSANMLGGWARACAATVDGNCSSETGDYHGQQ